MNAITATRRTIRREWTAFGALLIVSVGLMGMSGTQTAHDIQSAANWAVMPVETFLNSAADTVGSYWSALTQIDRLRTENEQLKLENQTLQEELERAPAIAKLNDDWTKITSIASGVQYQTTPVRVIVRDVSGVNQRTLIVNKGSNDGLVVDEVVIDAGGALVGRIQSVDATVSTILLISDPASVVVGRAYLVGTASASASPTAAPSAAPGSATGTATGTISGTISGQLQMSNIDVTPEQCKTLKGKYVVTAGESLPGTNDTSPLPAGSSDRHDHRRHVRSQRGRPERGGQPRGRTERRHVPGRDHRLPGRLRAAHAERLPWHIRESGQFGEPARLGQSGDLRRPGQLLRPRRLRVVVGRAAPKPSEH